MLQIKRTPGIGEALVFTDDKCNKHIVGITQFDSCLLSVPLFLLCITGIVDRK